MNRKLLRRVQSLERRPEFVELPPFVVLGPDGQEVFRASSGMGKEAWSTQRYGPPNKRGVCRT